MGFMGSTSEKFQGLLEKETTLEKSGDDEHDALTDQVHNLDALSPLRNRVVREDYEQTVADAKEDEDEEEGEDEPT